MCGKFVASVMRTMVGACATLQRFACILMNIHTGETQRDLRQHNKRPRPAATGLDHHSRGRGPSRNHEAKADVAECKKGCRKAIAFASEPPVRMRPDQMCCAPGRVITTEGHNPVMLGLSPLGRAGEISKPHGCRGLIRVCSIFTGQARTTHAHESSAYSRRTLHMYSQVCRQHPKRCHA